MLFDQLCHKGLAPGEFAGCRHQDDHDLIGLLAGAHQHMAQETAVGVLVVDAQLVTGDHPHDGLDDAVCALVLDEAALHGHDPVRPPLIHAGDGALGLEVRADDGMHLAAVVPGVIHTEDGLHLADAGEQLFHRGLLHLQLLAVGDVHAAAAAAAGGIGAGGGLCGVGGRFAISRFASVEIAHDALLMLDSV